MKGGNDLALVKSRLEQLFSEWLLLPESRDLIRRLHYDVSRNSSGGSSTVASCVPRCVVEGALSPRGCSKRRPSLYNASSNPGGQGRTHEPLSKDIGSTCSGSEPGMAFTEGGSGDLSRKENRLPSETSCTRGPTSGVSRAQQCPSQSRVAFFERLQHSEKSECGEHEPIRGAVEGREYKSVSPHTDGWKLPHEERERDAVSSALVELDQLDLSSIETRLNVIFAGLSGTAAAPRSSPNIVKGMKDVHPDSRTAVVTPSGSAVEARDAGCNASAESSGVHNITCRGLTESCLDVPLGDSLGLLCAEKQVNGAGSDDFSLRLKPHHVDAGSTPLTGELSDSKRCTNLVSGSVEGDICNPENDEENNAKGAFNVCHHSKGGEAVSKVCSPKGIPRFFFQDSTTVPADRCDPRVVEKVEGLYALRATAAGLNYAEFESKLMVECLGMSKYLAGPVFEKLDVKKSGFLSKEQIIQYGAGRFYLDDPTATFFHIVRQDHNDFIWGYDFGVYIQVVLDRHPGLEFLKAAPEYQKHYMATVITRLLYTLDLHGTGKVYLCDLRRFEQSQRHEYRSSDMKEKTADTSSWKDGVDSAERKGSSELPPMHLAGVWSSLDDAENTNHERLFFSYEHFYVIYYLFCDLDSNHDLLIDQQDLLRYDQHALSMRTINRVVSVLRLSEKMTLTGSAPFVLEYEDFIVFLINEEDKTTARSLEFWFNVVDLDGDGYIRYYEMKHFYDEQCERLEALNQEAIPFDNIMCQMNDLLNPKVPGQFTLTDFIRHRKASGVFFDMLLSLTKALTREFRDPYQVKQELEDYPTFSAWDRFALREYHSLMLVDEEEDNEDEGHLEKEDLPSTMDSNSDAATTAVSD